MAIYKRHTPETTVLYQTIARVWPGLSMEYSAGDAPIAEHIETELQRYLRCGILPYGLSVAVQGLPGIQDFRIFL